MEGKEVEGRGKDIRGREERDRLKGEGNRWRCGRK